MASIFNSLHIGYSGLNAAQVGINTTGHNISNAEVDGYSRQRVVATTATPVSTQPGHVGNGVEIQTIKRVFDNFVFDRYTESYAEKEYTSLESETLKQLSTYFPEIDEVGIKADLQEYYNMWQTFADNPDNDSIKLALVKQADILSEHIQYTQDKVKTLQIELNNQIKVNVDKVNSIAKELSDINKSIDTAEAGSLYTANDLRDKRNVMERDLSRLIGAVTNSGQLEANIEIDTNSNTKTGSYSVHVNGFNIVDGSSYHPIHVGNDQNSNGFYEIAYEREDGVLVPMEENLNGGKVGALLALRGSTINSTSNVPSDGILQNTITQLDAFANGLIESTNNLYAATATNRMGSNFLTVDPADPIVTQALNVNTGTFNIVVYDVDGNIAAKRAINIDIATTITTAGSNTNSIQYQMEATVDDNQDGNANNDIDDFLQFNWATSADKKNLEFSLDNLSRSRGYTFAIEDNLTTDKYASGTNFAGALGMRRFFDGDDGSSISVASELKANPSLVLAGFTNVAGDSRAALSMVQHQFEHYKFDVAGTIIENTTNGMFDVLATDVGISTNSAILREETVSTQFNAIELEYFSTSKVSIDEEMTNLIKYQTSYGASAKIITTIDQMMQTLLGIKQ